MAIGKSSIARAANSARIKKAEQVPQPEIAVQTPAFEQLPTDALWYLKNDRCKKAAPSSALAESVRTNGILEPLLAAVLPDGTLYLLSGHQRLAAARLCGMSAVPAVILPAADSAEAEKMQSELAAFSTGVRIQEEKFAAISSVHSDLPEYLL